MTNDYHDRRAARVIAMSGKARPPTAPGAPTIAYRANTTTHDSDTIAMPGKHDHPRL